MAKEKRTFKLKDKVAYEGVPGTVQPNFVVTAIAIDGIYIHPTGPKQKPCSAGSFPVHPDQLMSMEDYKASLDA